MRDDYGADSSGRGEVRINYSEKDVWQGAKQGWALVLKGTKKSMFMAEIVTQMPSKIWQINVSSSGDIESGRDCDKEWVEVPT